MLVNCLCRSLEWSKKPADTNSSMRTHAGQVMMSFSLGCLPPTGTFVPAPLHSVASGTPRTAHGGSRGCIGWRCRRRHARTQSSVRGHRPNTLLPGAFVGHGAELTGALLASGALGLSVSSAACQPHQAVSALRGGLPLTVRSLLIQWAVNKCTASRRAVGVRTVQ